MPCYYPIPAVRTGSGAITLRKEAATMIGHFSNTNEPRYADIATEALSLPCGTCIGCRKSAARAWSLRCQLELQQHKHATFTTLTYNDENLPPTLRPRDLQLFLKRLRKRLASRRLRFFAAGEYGEQNNRPHYHAILYGANQNDRALVDETWGAGYTQTVNVTPAAIAYTAGYCAKKITWRQEAAQERIDYTTGEVYHWQPPFLQMSRKPGIGGHARQHYTNSWRLFAVDNATRLAVPRFLRKAWDELASLERNSYHSEAIEDRDYQQWQNTLTRDKSPQRLEAAEKISIAQTALQAQRRKL